MNLNVLSASKGNEPTKLQDLEEAPQVEQKVVEVTYSDDNMLSEIENILTVRDHAAQEAFQEGPYTLQGEDADRMKFEMGGEMFDQGYYFQARDIYSELVRRGYREYDSLVRLGSAQRKLGNLAEAAASLNKALVLDTTGAEAWHQLGMLMLETERPMLNEARAFLRQANRLDPGDDQITSSLQRCEMMIKGYTA